MKIIAIDTNILLNFQLQRDPGLEQVNELFQRCLNSELQIYVPEIVFAEDEWVLRSVYKKPKSLILDFFEELLEISNVILPNRRKINSAVDFFKNTNLKFSDCLIMAEVDEFEPDEFLTSDYELQKAYQRLN